MSGIQSRVEGSLFDLSNNDMADEQKDEFAGATRPSATQFPTAKSEVEIVSSLYQAQRTQTAEERRDYLAWTVGDLPIEKREIRFAQEKCWKTEKQTLQDFYIDPPMDADNMVAIGVTERAAYMLHSPNKSLKPYYQALLQLERASVDMLWKWRLNHLVKTKEHAKQLRSYVLSIMQNDPLLKPVAEKYVLEAEALMESLPEVSEEKLDFKPSDRPGGEPVITYVPKSEIKSVNKVDVAAQHQKDLFYILSCSVKDAKQKWQAISNIGAIPVKEDTVPCVALSEQGNWMVIVAQVSDEVFELFCYEITSELGRVGKKPQKHLSFSFESITGFQHGGGRLSATISNDGNYCVSCSNCTYLANEAAIIVANREVTYATYMGDNVMIGTNLGECYFVTSCPQGEESPKLVLDTERTPAFEPIYSITHSNYRLLMQTSLGFSANLLPYHMKEFHYFPCGRLLAHSVCGTLIFVLEKYGYVQVYSTLVRQTIHPFKPPTTSTPWFRKDGLCPVAYQGIHAGCERVAILYPSGLVRVLRIKEKVARELKTSTTF